MRFGLAGALFALAACVGPRQSWVDATRVDMAGLDKTGLQMCAGFPNHSRPAGPGSEIWSYELRPRNQGGISVGAPVFGLFTGSVSLSEAGTCKMQVRLVDGRVREVAFAGDKSRPQGHDLACAPLVEGCYDYIARKRLAQAAPAADRSRAIVRESTAKPKAGGS